MDNIKIITFTNDATGESSEYVIKDLGNGCFESTPKSVYDEQQANQASGTIS